MRAQGDADQRRTRGREQERDSQTLPIAASQPNGLNRGQLTAIGAIVVAPMILAGLAVNPYLVKGLTLGAVAGE